MIICSSSIPEALLGRESIWGPRSVQQSSEYLAFLTLLLRIDLAKTMKFNDWGSIAIFQQLLAHGEDVGWNVEDEVERLRAQLQCSIVLHNKGGM